MASTNLSDAHHEITHDEQASSDHHNVSQSNITCMGSKFYEAAAAGDIGAFKKNLLPNQHLDQLLTPNRNTILHIYVTAAESDKETKFVEEILNICPPLLLQANVKGETPLYLAARYGHLRIVELLFERAKAGHKDLEGSNEEEDAAKQMLRMRTRENDTALHEAVRSQHLNVVQTLINEDPGFSYSANDSGETPLYMAAERGYLDVFREILTRCSSPATGGPNNRTVLHAVAIANNREMTVEVLKRFGNLTKEADVNGLIPLHHAAALNYVEVVKLMLEHDKDTAYIKNEDGMTALHLAAVGGHHKVMKEIISPCRDCCELVDSRGWNVLHYAVESNSNHAVKVILNDYSLRNLINEKDFDGNTPLMHTVTSCKYKITSLHSHLAVDMMAFNKQNQNALDIAIADTKANPIKGISASLFKLRKLRSNLRIPMNYTRNVGVPVELQTFSEKTTEALLVANTLIATVTFAAGFTLPGGYVSDEGPLLGSPILRENTAFKAFIITNSLAMMFSVSAVYINLNAIASHDKSNMMSFHVEAVWLTVLAMGAMMIAFVTGTYAVLAHSDALATSTCVIGLSFFIFFFLVVKKNSASQ